MYSSPTDYINHVYMARFYQFMVTAFLRFEIDPFGKIYGDIQLNLSLRIERVTYLKKKKQAYMIYFPHSHFLRNTHKDKLACSY